MNFNSYEDLEKLIHDNVHESISLEYKGTKILIKKDAQSICKAVSAFANSAGGTFLIGISESEDSIKLDGGWSGTSKIDWLHRVISSGTFPPVDTFKITEIESGSGYYYIIAVTVSPNAPHQAQDNRYYKRHGPHTDPMEHYEIEDIRNRPRGQMQPLEISLFPQEQLLSLKIKNASSQKTINRIKIEIDSNFEFDRRSITSLKEHGIRQIRSGVEHVFLIGTSFEILSKNENAEIHILGSGLIA